MATKNIKDMSFLDHLEELRWVLVEAAGAIAILSVVAYFVRDYIFDGIIFGPTKPDFFTYRFFCEATNYFGFDKSLCIDKMDFVIQNTLMEGQVNIFIWVCVTAGFIFGFPYMLWLLWGFISPALYEKEKKNAKLFIFIASILFFIGVLFGYYLICLLYTSRCV